MITDLVAQRAMDRLAREGLAALSDEERIAATVWLFDSGVRNSGFLGYFSSKKGDLATHAPAALHRIGAFKSAEIAREANAFFGGADVPANQEDRKNIMSQLDDAARRKWAELDERYAACDEDVDEFLERFLSKHT